MFHFVYQEQDSHVVVNFGSKSTHWSYRLLADSKQYSLVSEVESPRSRDNAYDKEYYVK